MFAFRLERSRDECLRSQKELRYVLLRPMPLCAHLPAGQTELNNGGVGGQSDTDSCVEGCAARINNK